MRACFEQWIQEEYIRLVLLADELLGKEQLVDFYYGKTQPERERAHVIISDLIPMLDELLETIEKQMDDTPPFYFKTIFNHQVTSFKIYLENKLSPQKTDYAQTIEALLGVKLTEPDWPKYRQCLENSLQAAGYSGQTEEMLKKWQQEGLIDVFSFMDEAKQQIPWLWEEVSSKALPVLLSNDEIDFLQGTSELKFCYLDNIWEDWPYYGGYRRYYMTMIALNARLFWNRFEIKALLAHEVLPGRHLFWSLRQRLHDLGQFPKIGMLSTFASPERLVQEGIIACANEFMWPEGLANPKEQVALDYWNLRRAVGLMAAIKLYQNKEPVKQVQQFIQEQAILSPGKAKALLGIIQEQPYHYPSTQLGYELVHELWQAHGEDFWLEFSQYRSPALLQKLYPLPDCKNNKKGGARGV